MLKQVIKLNKHFASSYVNLSNCFLSQKKYDDALAVLHKSLELNLNVTDSQLGIINILFYYANVTEEFSKWASSRT